MCSILLQVFDFDLRNEARGLSIWQNVVSLLSEGHPLLLCIATLAISKAAAQGLRFLVQRVTAVQRQPTWRPNRLPLDQLVLGSIESLKFTPQVCSMNSFWLLTPPKHQCLVFNAFGLVCCHLTTSWMPAWLLESMLLFTSEYSIGLSLRAELPSELKPGIYAFLLLLACAHEVRQLRFDST